MKRELKIFRPLGDYEFDVQDRSSVMTGSAPPGLRFPCGAICGTHLLFSGTYLSNSYQAFSIWALDLRTLVWSRIDPGSGLSAGAWFRACLWSSPFSPAANEQLNVIADTNKLAESRNKLVVFGDRSGSIAEDYIRRLLSWEDVFMIDLEVFGICQPPKLALDIKAQKMGLAALEEQLFADFEIICEDGRGLKCSRILLEERWEWFRNETSRWKQDVEDALESMGLKSFTEEFDYSEGSGSQRSSRSSAKPPAQKAIVSKKQTGPRLTSRTLAWTEPYSVSLAFLQYLYSFSLTTTLHRAPPILSHLLVLSTDYNIPHLRTLVVHAMHSFLNPSTSLGVYEIATLCGCQGLQIRALKYVMVSFNLVCVFARLLWRANLPAVP